MPLAFGLFSQMRSSLLGDIGRNWQCKQTGSQPFYDWWAANPERWQMFEKLAQKIDREKWQGVKEETSLTQSEQLKRFSFLHRREQFLSILEERWASTSETACLH